MGREEDGEGAQGRRLRPLSAQQSMPEASRLLRLLLLPRYAPSRVLREGALGGLALIREGAATINLNDRTYIRTLLLTLLALRPALDAVDVKQ